jgi:hypothetical protein
VEPDTFGAEKREAYESEGGEETGLRLEQCETVAPNRAGRNIWREEGENVMKMIGGQEVRCHIQQRSNHV